MGTLSKRELDALVEEAIVDAYEPPPAGAAWIAAYRHGLTGA